MSQTGRFPSSRAMWIGAIVISSIVVCALIAPWLSPYRPEAQSVGNPLSEPSPRHWFGTDELGRDIFTRVVFAGRIALAVGTASPLLAAIIGVPIGMITGYFGGWLDSILMRFTDAWLAFPIMILALAMSAALGPGLRNAIIAVTFVSIPTYIRLARGQTLVVKTHPYVESARAIAQREPMILWRYILPNIVSVLIVQASLTSATAIITESALSFLGVGVMPPSPSWGAMLRAAQPFLIQAPWVALAPGLAIFVLVMGINLLGDGLRDVLDPRLN